MKNDMLIVGTMSNGLFIPLKTKEYRLPQLGDVVYCDGYWHIQKPLGKCNVEVTAQVMQRHRLSLVLDDSVALNEWADQLQQEDDYRMQGW